jgi:hypothetical protein
VSETFPQAQRPVFTEHRVSCFTDRTSAAPFDERADRELPVISLEAILRLHDSSV